MKKIIILTTTLLICLGIHTIFAEEQDPVMPETTTETITVNTTTVETTTEITTQIKYTTVNLNCRTAPSMNSEIVSTLPVNSKITIVENNKEWDKVLINNSYYYMYADFLGDTPIQIKETPKLETAYLGKYQLTAYCACTKCTGGLGITASGTKPIQGRTVGCNGIPLGTKIYIEGYGTYIVEDTGNMSNSVIDVFMDSHEAALQFGRKHNVDVYIIK